jgi:hypothetical protein
LRPAGHLRDSRGTNETPSKRPGPVLEHRPGPRQTPTVSRSSPNARTYRPRRRNHQRPRPATRRTDPTSRQATIHRRELAASGDRYQSSQLAGCSSGDHTAHRRIRYRPGTVEGARPMNRDARRPDRERRRSVSRSPPRIRRTASLQPASNGYRSIWKRSEVADERRRQIRG